MLCSKPPPSYLWKLCCAGCAHSHTETSVSMNWNEWMNEVLLSFSQTHAFERYLLAKVTGRTPKMQHQPIILPWLTASVSCWWQEVAPTIPQPAAHAGCQCFSYSWSITAPACTPAVSHQKGTLFLDLNDALQWWTKCPNAFLFPK